MHYENINCISFDFIRSTSPIFDFSNSTQDHVVDRMRMIFDVSELQTICVANAHGPHHSQKKAFDQYVFVAQQ